VCTKNSILAPRIHGELLKLGFEVAQSSVAKYMVKRCGPPSQGWRTFLRNHAPSRQAWMHWACDAAQLRVRGPDPKLNFSSLSSNVLFQVIANATAAAATIKTAIAAVSTVMKVASLATSASRWPLRGPWQQHALALRCTASTFLASTTVRQRSS
jgi:hypothetical protein